MSIKFALTEGQKHPPSILANFHLLEFEVYTFLPQIIQDALHYNFLLLQ
jgi:hypothetical protein